MKKIISPVLYALTALLLILGLGILFTKNSDLPLKDWSALPLSFSLETAEPVREVSGVLDIKEIQSPSGMTAWLVEDHSVPVVSIHFGFKGAGTVIDPVDKQGLVQLVSNTMDEGAGKLTSAEFQSALRNQAIKLRFTADRDYFGGSLQTLTRNKHEAFKLLRLALTEPRFDPEPLERMKNANISRIRNSLHKPEWRSVRLAYDKAFEGHPYAKNSGGTISGLEAVTPDDLHRFVKTYLGKDRLYVGISGDLTVREAERALEEIFGGLQETSKDVRIEDIEIRNQSGSFHHPMDIPQTHIQLWHPGIPRSADNYTEAVILNNIFGRGGFGSRLMESAREQKGLTYGIYSYFQHFDHSDVLVISTSTKNENTPQMMSLIIKEIQKLQETGITEQELKATKSYLTGSIPLRFTSNPAISGTLMAMQIEDLDISYFDQHIEKIKAAKLEDINNLAKTYPTIEGFMGITVGQPQGLDNDPDMVIETLPNAR